MYIIIPAAYVRDHQGLISASTKKYSINPITMNQRKMNAILDMLLRLNNELSANDVDSNPILNNDAKTSERSAFSGMAECLAYEKIEASM